LLLNAFLDQEILTFVVVVVLAAFDFWTVKNVTGRLLVNLRWWSEIDEYGKESWLYESEPQRLNAEGEVMQQQVGATDSKVFWWALYMTPAVWSLLFLVELLSFSVFWMITIGICFTLSFINAQGYHNCAKDHKQKLTQYLQERGMTVFQGAMKTSFFSNALSKVAMPSFFRGRGGN